MYMYIYTHINICHICQTAGYNASSIPTMPGYGILWLRVFQAQAVEGVAHPSSLPKCCE